ncbi:MAG: bile acid:sodium symporter [Planctomycetota bacterium]|nr:bile acid:sodium symporter [Planctomycetota bacterium]
MKRYWFLVALALVVPLGLLWPEGGRRLREAGAVLPALVATTLLITGFTLDPARLARQARNIRGILLALGTTYVVAPLLAYGLAILWGPETPLDTGEGLLFLQAVMIAAAQAGTLASAIALTAVARGDQELALVLTLSTNGLTPLLTPLVLQLSVGAVVDLPVGEMMLRMALVVLLPVAAGQVARRLLRSTATPAMTVIKFVPQCIVLVFVYCGFAAAGASFGQDGRLMLEFLGLAVSLHLLLLGWTYGTATLLRLPAGERVAVVFCGSQKTLPNGIYVWSRFFAGNPYGAVPLVLYHVFQLFVDALVVPWLEPRRSGKRRPRRREDPKNPG